MSDVGVKKFAIYPKGGFRANEMQKHVIGVARSTGEMMNEPILPHILTDGIIRDNLYRATQGNAIPIMVVAKTGLVVRLKIIHFHGVRTCRHPNLMETICTYLGHLHRTRITVGVNGSNGHVLALGQQVCRFFRQRPFIVQQNSIIWLIVNSCVNSPFL